MMRTKSDAWNFDSATAGAPAWLGDTSPENDVCISSRARIMRNLAGFRFPHHATGSECREVCDRIIAVSIDEKSNKWIRGLGAGERDALVAKCLISHDFPFDKPGRAVMLDEPRRISIMVNEEDHLRIQALTAGWSIDFAREEVQRIETEFSALRFAYSPRFGHLSSSPHNCGEGVRISAMFHLIALATTKRLLNVLRAMDAMDVVARGLYGESSRAIGAFLQASVTSHDFSRLQAVGEVLIKEERLERAKFSPDEVAQRAQEAILIAIASRSLSLADALRVLGWIRWAASIGLPQFPAEVRQVDSWRTSLEFRTGQNPLEADRQRAALFRTIVEPLQRRN